MVSYLIYKARISTQEMMRLHDMVTARLQKSLDVLDVKTVRRTRIALIALSRLRRTVHFLKKISSSCPLSGKKIIFS